MIWKYIGLEIWLSKRIRGSWDFVEVAEGGFEDFSIWRYNNLLSAGCVSEKYEQIFEIEM